MPGQELPAGMAEALAESADALAAERLDAAENLESIVSEMISLRDQVDATEEMLKQVKAAYDDVRKRRLPEKMQELGLVGPTGRGSFTHSSGANVSLRVKVQATVKKDDRDATYAWLKENGHASLIQETVNAQTLGAFVRERLEDGEPLPPGVSTFVETIAVITKPKE